MTDTIRNPNRSLAITASGDRTNFWLCAILLGACLLFGGGGGGFGDSVLQLFSLLVLLVAGVRLMMNPALLDAPLLALLSGIVVLVAIQLIPLPPAVWQHLGGRAELVQQMAMVGIHPGWHALTLSPTATERSLLTLLPGVAICLSAMTMTTHSRIRLVLVVCVFAQLSLLLELAQIADGPDSALRLYGSGSTASAGGFYANPGHFACVLAMMIPFLVALLVTTMQANADNRPRPLAWIVLLCLMIGAFLVALPITGARAGLGLGALAVAGSLGMLLRAGLGRRIVLKLIALGVLGLLLFAAFDLDSLLSRNDLNPSTDLRWPMHANTLEAARHFGPLGSGLGTFVSAYQAVEPIDEMRQEYVNHAHGDYHELWLEAGWPGLALIALFLGWYLWRGGGAWARTAASPDALNIARASSTAILVVLAYSWVDYPLRNTATLAFFGLCCALLARGGGSSAEWLKAIE